jgi:hypothetical protein
LHCVVLTTVPKFVIPSLIFSGYQGSHNKLNTLRIFSTYICICSFNIRVNLRQCRPRFANSLLPPFFYFRKVNNGTYDAGVAVNDIRVHCDENRFGVSEGMELCFPFKKSRITILRLHRYLYNTHAAGLVRRRYTEGWTRRGSGFDFRQSRQALGST